MVASISSTSSHPFDTRLAIALEASAETAQEPVIPTIVDDSRILERCLAVGAIALGILAMVLVFTSPIPIFYTIRYVILITVNTGMLFNIIITPLIILAILIVSYISDVLIFMVGASLIDGGVDTLVNSLSTTLSSPINNFSVDIDNLTNNPKSVLIDLGNNFLLQNQFLPIISYFQNGQQSEGFDVGGVRRDFLSRMMKSLFTEEIGNNRLKVNDMGWPEENIENENEVVCYRTLGRIMALCYQNPSLNPGHMFPENVFKAIAAFSDPTDPTPEDWISAYLILKGIPFDILKLCGDEVDLSSISDNVLSYAGYLYNEDSEWTPEETRDFFQKAKNKEALQGIIVEKALDEPLLGPIFTMAKEMKIALGDTAWNELCAEPLLMQKIQGFIDRNAVKNALEWIKSNNVYTENHTKTIRFMMNWIERASLEQLTQFVYAVTGNKALSSTMEMKIYTYNSGYNIPASHTCSMSMELSAQYAGQAMFDAKVSIFLEHATSGTGFTFA